MVNISDNIPNLVHIAHAVTSRSLAEAQYSSISTPLMLIIDVQFALSTVQPGMHCWSTIAAPHIEFCVMVVMTAMDLFGIREAKGTKNIY